MKIVYTIIPFLFLANTIISAESPVENFKLSKEGVEVLEIDCEAGFLKVYGDKELNQIEVEAELEIDITDKNDLEDFIQDHVRLSLEKKGNRAILISHIDDHSFFRRHAEINLTVKIPQPMNLRVEDGSGWIEIKDIDGNLFVDDGSGDIDISNIKGDVEIDDGSGETNLNNISGYVEIDDGSGELEIENIRGDLNVDDGSGDMKITNINGNVFVTDGSGSININGVDKDVTIKEAGSGGLSIHDVKGKVEKRD